MPESKDNELSLDELKDVSGAGMGLDRLGTQFNGKKGPANLKGDRVSPVQLKVDEVRIPRESENFYQGWAISKGKG